MIVVGYCKKMVRLRGVRIRCIELQQASRVVPLHCYQYISNTSEYSTRDPMTKWSCSDSANYPCFCDPMTYGVPQKVRIILVSVIQ